MSSDFSIIFRQWFSTFLLPLLLLLPQPTVPLVSSPTSIYSFLSTLLYNDSFLDVLLKSFCLRMRFTSAIFFFFPFLLLHGTFLSPLSIDLLLFCRRVCDMVPPFEHKPISIVQDLLPDIILFFVSFDKYNQRWNHVSENQYSVSRWCLAWWIKCTRPKTKRK